MCLQPLLKKTKLKILNTVALNCHLFWMELAQNAPHAASFQATNWIRAEQKSRIWIVRREARTVSQEGCYNRQRQHRVTRGRTDV